MVKYITIAFLLVASMAATAQVPAQVEVKEDGDNITITIQIDKYALGQHVSDNVEVDIPSEPVPQSTESELLQAFRKSYDTNQGDVSKIIKDFTIASLKEIANEVDSSKKSGNKTTIANSIIEKIQ